VVGALEKGDAAPGDEEITMDALYRYVRQRAKAEGVAATPQCFVLGGGVADLVIARNPDGGAALIDPKTMAALGSEERLPRLGAVTDLLQHVRARDTAQARAAHLVLKRHLKRERDYGVRDSILAGLDGGAKATHDAEPRPEPAAGASAARGAKPDPAPAYKPETTTAHVTAKPDVPPIAAGGRSSHALSDVFTEVFGSPAGQTAAAAQATPKPGATLDGVLKVAGAIFLTLIILALLQCSS
jgi:hypothetical protein